MRRKIAGTVGSVLLCALLLAGCGSVTASQQQEGETSMAGSASESQVDIDVSSSKAELDDEQAQKLRVQAEELFENLNIESRLIQLRKPMICRKTKKPITR